MKVAKIKTSHCKGVITKMLNKLSNNIHFPKNGNEVLMYLC